MVEWRGNCPVKKRWNIFIKRAGILPTVKIRPGWSLPPQSLTCSRLREGKTRKTKCFTHSHTSDCAAPPTACSTQQCSAWEAKTWLIALWLGPTWACHHCIVLLHHSLPFCSNALFQGTSVWYGIVWYDDIWYGIVCYDWYGNMWYGMVWLEWLPCCRLSHHPWAHPYLQKWRLR